MEASHALPGIYIIYKEIALAGKDWKADAVWTSAEVLPFGHIARCMILGKEGTSEFFNKTILTRGLNLSSIEGSIVATGVMIMCNR
jgi:hypothetical protein